MRMYKELLCVEGGWLVKEGVMCRSTYDWLKNAGHILSMRRGHRGCPALIAYDSIPRKYKEIILAKFGNPYELIKNKDLHFGLSHTNECK